MQREKNLQILLPSKRDRKIRQIGTEIILQKVSRTTTIHVLAPALGTYSFQNAENLVSS